MTEILENTINEPVIEQIHINTTDAIAAKQAKKTEALKRAKAKYYQSIKEKPEFIERIAKNSKIYYERHKDEPAFKEYREEYYKLNKDKLNEYCKQSSSKRVLCECNCNVSWNTIARHKRSPKHLDIMKELAKTLEQTI